MNDIQLFRQLISNKDNQVTTTSRKIAELFGKQHKNVLRAIDRSLSRRPDLSQYCIEKCDSSGPNGRALRFYEVHGYFAEMMNAKFSIGAKAGDVESDYLDRIQDIFPHKQIRQMAVCDGKYRVDCYIPSLSIVVEVYEKEHSQKIDNDIERQRNIQQWIAEKKAAADGVSVSTAMNWTGFIVIHEGSFGLGVRDILNFVHDEFMSIDPVICESYWNDCDMEWY
ncbi:MAG: Rha family transcriptional regulator [Plesiomonas shigelloides]